MKRKTAAMTAGVLALVLLFGGYALLRRNNEKKAEQEAAESAAAPVLDLEAENLLNCSFDIEGSRQTFLHEGDSWLLESDESFPVNEEALGETLSCFSPLTPVRTLTDVSSLKDYGLYSPSNTFTLTEKDGNEKTVRLGDTNEGTGDVYIQLDEDETKVYTVSSAILSAVKERLYDYALSEELPSFSAEDLTKVEIIKDGLKSIYEKTEDGWKKAGESADAKEESASESDEPGEMIKKLAPLSYSGYFEHACTEDEKYGLRKENQLTLCYRVEDEAPASEREPEKEGEGDSEARTETTEEAEETDGAQGIIESLTFLIGDQAENGDYYVRRIDSGQVHTLSKEALSIFALTEENGED